MSLPPVSIISNLLTEDPDITAQWAPDNLDSYRERLLAESNTSKRGPNCTKCGQWYVGGSEHECKPNTPITAHFPIKFWGLASKIRDFLDKKYGIHFDSGSDGRTRDWQFEMLDVDDRLRVVSALKMLKIPFQVRTGRDREIHSF